LISAVVAAEEGAFMFLFSCEKVDLKPLCLSWWNVA